jgi:arginine/lysine/ornithine decarboxylase
MTINSDMPLFDALRKYTDMKFLPFHMPGHMGGSVFPADFGKLMIDFDHTELPDLDNLYSPCGAIERAQKKAAIAFGADRTFFLVNGSTAGIHAMIAGSLKMGDKLIIPRNCHRSVIAAMALWDIQPIYIRNEYSEEHALVLPITPEQVLQAFKCNPDASGILLVNPDYYGVCGYLAEIGKIAHDCGKLLLVDEAHGAHLTFHKDLPTSAAYADADIWVQSAHKTLPALTQTALLHIKGNRVDPDRVLRMLSLFQSSSPSYMLMASLDWARWFMEAYGYKRLDEVINSIKTVTLELKKRWGIKTICDYELKRHICATDPTRLCLDLSSRSISGYEALIKLRDQKVEPEMADFHRLVFISTVAHDANAFKILLDKLDLMLEFSDVSKPLPDFPVLYGSLPVQIMSPRQTFNSIIENIPLKLCEDRVCGQAIGAYPPGIPRFNPGELFDREGLEELLAIKSLGGNLFGLIGDGLVSVVKRGKDG